MYNIMLWRKMERHGDDGYYMILQGIVVYSRLVEDKYVLCMCCPRFSCQALHSCLLLGLLV